MALQKSSPNSLVVVFTDNGTKDLKLEREIVRLRDTKKCEVYIVLTPQYEGYLNGKSLPAYGRMASMGSVRVIQKFTGHSNLVAGFSDQ